MNEEELLKHISFTDDKVIFDKSFYQEVMLPCFSNSITYKNIVKELQLENQQLKQQLEKRDNIINYCKFEIKKEKDKFPCPLESEEWLKGRISAFEEILNIDKGE